MCVEAVLNQMCSRHNCDLNGRLAPGQHDIRLRKLRPTTVSTFGVYLLTTTSDCRFGSTTRPAWNLGNPILLASLRECSPDLPMVRLRPPALLAPSPATMSRRLPSHRRCSSNLQPWGRNHWQLGRRVPWSRLWPWGRLKPQGALRSPLDMGSRWVGGLPQATSSLQLRWSRRRADGVAASPRGRHGHRGRRGPWGRRSPWSAPCGKAWAAASRRRADGVAVAYGVAAVNGVVTGRGDAIRAQGRPGPWRRTKSTPTTWSLRVMGSLKPMRPQGRRCLWDRRRP